MFRPPQKAIDPAPLGQWWQVNVAIVVDEAVGVAIAVVVAVDVVLLLLLPFRLQLQLAWSPCY